MKILLDAPPGRRTAPIALCVLQGVARAHDVDPGTLTIVITERDLRPVADQVAAALGCTLLLITTGKSHDVDEHVRLGFVATASPRARRLSMGAFA